MEIDAIKSYLILQLYWTYIIFIFFFFNDTATTEIYTLSLHDALPIYGGELLVNEGLKERVSHVTLEVRSEIRSEEHTSELQSQSNLVCRLLLEKKKKNINNLSTSLSDAVTSPLHRTASSTTTTHRRTY